MNVRSNSTRGIAVFGLALASVLMAAAESPAATPLPVQITADDSGTGCASSTPVSDSTGTIAAWQSDCDPATTNADGSTEIFRAIVGSAPVQLTDKTACTSSRPTISADGTRIAFESDCDLVGANADGNIEIFLWKNGTLSQLTTSTDCENLAPSINGPGSFVAFDSTCNIFGTNNDGRGSEIYRVSVQGVLKQLTTDATGNCDSTSASIDSSGNLVAFDSDCDLTGENENLAVEIFTVTSAGAVRQLTFAPDDSCSSVHPEMDAAGTIVGFHSDCDFTGGNPDAGDEIFTVTTASRTVQQVSSSPLGAACASGEVRMASSGGALAFSSYCKLAGNSDGSIEVYQVTLGGSSVGGLLAVTSGSDCSSMAGGLSADGSRVMFDSDCNPSGDNADGSVEVFRASACACGAPNTRRLPPQDPLASDALLILKGAVGSASCAACECDTNDDGKVSSTDALRTLKAVVGEAGITLDCPSE